MLYHILLSYIENFSAFNVVKYITFRAIASLITSLLFTLLFCPKLIKLLKYKKVLENINDVVPENHKCKQGTPTMGGIIIIISVIFSSLMWNNISNFYVIVVNISFLLFGIIGFLDDYLKNYVKINEGLRPKYKLISQTTISILVLVIVYFIAGDSSHINELSIPLFGTYTINSYSFIAMILLMIFYVLFVVGLSNGVNITDGLDGLASGTISIAFLGLGIISYVKGHSELSSYLHIAFLPQAGELTIFIAALIGTMLGFLWFNSYPASIFMGDTGALALGGILALLAILLKVELLFCVIGFIFILEVVTSATQTCFFKITRKMTGTGKRLFKRAPLHHHYEELGLPEQKIVVRFWIVAVLLLAIGLLILKTQ